MTLDVEDIARRIENGVCEVTGLSFSLRANSIHRIDPFSPSLDRFDPKGAYTKSNTRVVVAAFNVAKGQWSLDIFEAIARGFIERNRA